MFTDPWSRGILPENAKVYIFLINPTLTSVSCKPADWAHFLVQVYFLVLFVYFSRAQHFNYHTMVSIGKFPLKTSIPKRTIGLQQALKYSCQFLERFYQDRPLLSYRLCTAQLWEAPFTHTKLWLMLVVVVPHGDPGAYRGSLCCKEHNVTNALI